MPISTPAAPTGAETMRPKPPASTGWVVAIGLLLVSGIVQGRLTGRWATSSALREAVARLDLMPRQVGTWIGEDAEVDRATLERVGIGGGIVRRYRDTRTGATATVMLVCGRPGPVSVHTPEVCYGGAGYELAAPPSEPIPGFLAATMARPGGAVPDRLQVYWSWNASGHWEVPTNPRLTYGPRPYLYKLYVIRSATSAGDDLASGPAADLARTLGSAFAPGPPRR